MTLSSTISASTRLLARFVLIAVGAIAITGCANTTSPTTAPPTSPTTPATARPVTTAPPSTTTLEPTTTAPAATTSAFVNPFSDAEIAARVLLDAEEYANGWQLFEFKKLVLDASVASAIPGCSRYLGTIFESEDRPATTAGRWFHAPPGRKAAMSQYVVVFPTDTAAEVMFEATLEPAFRHDCFAPYYDPSRSSDGFCCNPTDLAAAPLHGEPVESTKTLGSNDIQFRTDTQYWNDAAGTRHGPEKVDSATIRVGRVICVIEAIKTDEFGAPLVTDAEFDKAIATVSERAIHALGGVNH